ncbi:hypothetical protein [Microbacterium sp. NPDC087665]|uniref:hypothetical protein n=1 Tax=Microbacterium sp. NPDC087665 TaxID=3364194 RepID=UPI0037F4E7E8
MPHSPAPVDMPSETEASRAQVSSRREGGRLWPRATTALLLLVGIAMGLIGFVTVMSLGDLGWHGARDAELRATYEAYQDTGTLLIKETGSGSYGVQAPADGPLTFATWDDDPGSYIIASLMYNITGSDSPYPGLRVAQALLVAIPLVWLPLAVARVVGRARAGYAMVLLPLVVWLFNHGATLVGTEYGLSDRVNTLPVYSLYGTAASLAFLSLALIVLLSTYRLRWLGLVGATVGISVLAAFGNMSRSLSGMGIAAAVGVLWWIFARGRWRWAAALGGALIAVLLASVIQTGLMAAINVDRSETTGQAMTEVPDAHTAWHSLYLGLSYPTPLNGEPSHFAVTWADEYGWAKAREIDPDVLVASEEYDKILQGLYLDEVLGDPVGAVKLYLQKALYVAKHFGGLVLFIIIGFAVGMSIRSGPRPRLGRVLAIVTPLFLLGLVPAIMVMPMLYYYSELSAALGLLAAVSLGVIVWAATSWPARVRAREQQRTAADLSQPKSRAGVSVVVDDTFLREGDVERIAAALSAGDEVVVVGGASPADGDSAAPVPTHAPVHRVASVPEDGIGRRLRAGVLSSVGERVIVVGGPLDAEPSALAQLAAAEGASEADHDADREAPAGVLRSILLGARTSLRGRVIVLDGDAGRAIVRASKETDDLWFDEIAFGLEARGVRPEVLDFGTAAAAGDSEPPGSRGAFRTARRLSRIALRREEFASARPAR